MVEENRYGPQKVPKAVRILAVKRHGAQARPTVTPVNLPDQCAIVLRVSRRVAENDFGGANKKYRSYRLMII